VKSLDETRHEVHYECPAESRDHEKVKASLNSACKHSDVQKIIQKSKESKTYDKSKSSQKHATSRGYHEILSVVSDVPFNGGIIDDDACERCVLQRISGSIFIQDPNHMESRDLPGQFVTNFKSLLTNFINEHVDEFDSPLHSIEVTNLSKSNDGVTIDFIVYCDPLRNGIVRKALGQSIIKLRFKELFD